VAGNFVLIISGYLWFRSVMAESVAGFTSWLFWDGFAT